MGSSRATTPAGRRRAAHRAGTARSRPRPAAPRLKAARPPAKPKRTPKKAPAQKATRRSRPVPWLAILIALAIVAVGLAGAYLLWFRTSSFVAVEQVEVRGISGPQADQVTAALTEAAGGMSTLAVDEEALAAVGARFATVAAVTADADFPHGLVIEVTERPPVLVVESGREGMAVAGDGTVLAGVSTEKLRVPAISVSAAPQEGRVTGDALDLALVAGAAPVELRRLIEGLTVVDGDTIEVTLRGGVPVLFGGAEQAAEKWTAAAAVLADPKIDTLTYVDVRVPRRPAVGGAAVPVDGETTEPTEPITP